MSKIVVTGVKPTGTIHLGNYFGMIKPCVDIQGDHDSRVFVADLHALTSVEDPETLQQNIIHVVKAYLAAGLNPSQTILFKQSDIPEVTELGWVFNCLTTMPQLMRAHAFKDAEAKNKDINVGIFDYPLLMAADILIHNADIVPVGKDQRQHVEMAREVARKFNQTFSNVLKEPKEYIIESVETVIGTDGQKMSKSYNNTIPLFGSKEEITKAVMSIATDSASVEDPKDTSTNTIFKIHSLFLNDEEKRGLKEQYEAGGLGYKEAKHNCINAIESYIAPMREKYNSISDEEVIKILEQGKNTIRPIITKQMAIIRESLGLSFTHTK